MQKVSVPSVPRLSPISTAATTVRILLRLIAYCIIALIGAPYSQAADPSPGQALYEQHCAECHGRQGEGTAEHFSKPLAGERSVAQLARFIARSMPPDSPGTCSGEDAERVA